MAKHSNINSWYGWLPDRPDQRDKLYSAIAAPPRKLPSSVDLRPGCSGVEDQGQLGSCTANALAGNLEFLEKQSTALPADLSRLFIYYNERAMEGTINEDAGAFIRDGIKTLANLGVCTEAKWPYKIDRFATKPTAACFKEGLKHQVLSYHRITSLMQMKQCLAEGFPFVFGFTVYESFESDTVARTGKVNLPKTSEKTIGGHAVMAVGYSEAQKRFIVRNSWGTDWGLAGYFTMPYDYLSNNNLADDFWTIRTIEA